jgi:hypothetical protein
MGKRLVVLGVVAAFALSACGSSGGGSGGASGGTTGGTKAADTSGGTGSSGTSGGTSGGGGSGSGCSGFEAGKDGVVRTFCDGPGSAEITAGDKKISISGGECLKSGTSLTFNAGVVVGPDHKGTKPDYVGANLPQANGPFTNALVTVTSGGESLLLKNISGDHDADSATFTATVNFSSDHNSKLPGAKVSGIIRCG